MTTPLSTPAAQGTVAVTREMAEAGRKAIADERARVGMQYPDTLAVLAYQAMAPLAPSPEASPASGVEAVRTALERIARWIGEFPETGQFWDTANTEPMSYADCFGSNGERDFMRSIASEALAALTSAPAPEDRSGVRVKPLEWQPTSSGFCWHAASAVGRYFIEERHSDFRRNVEGWPGEWAVNTLDEAKAAAQADYEARILSALARDASPRGEAVAWVVIDSDAVPSSFEMLSVLPAGGYNLYAHPAPARAESCDNFEARYKWLRAWYLRGGQRREIHEHGHIIATTPDIFDAGVDAALSAPATEGRKG